MFVSILNTLNLKSHHFHWGWRSPPNIVSLKEESEVVTYNKKESNYACDKQCSWNETALKYVLEGYLKNSRFSKVTEKIIFDRLIAFLTPNSFLLLSSPHICTDRDMRVEGVKFVLKLMCKVTVPQWN